MPTRRTFLRGLTLAAGSSLCLATPCRQVLFGLQEAGEESDEQIFRGALEKARARGLATRPIGEGVASIGESFIGHPYAAHSLEVPGDERLVVNLRAFDCVTFVESMLALARCVKVPGGTYDDFQRELTLIRYRGGVLKGYESRLHYFTDWILDNGRKKILRDLSQELGGIGVREEINFMSAHAASYPRLTTTALLDSIKAAEKRLSARTWSFVPRGRVGAASQQMHPGDIIGMVPSVPGLDVTHTGLAVESKGMIGFLHAPLSGGKVQVSPGSLADYLERFPKTRGIVVARPLEPDRDEIPQQ